MCCKKILLLVSPLQMNNQAVKGVQLNRSLRTVTDSKLCFQLCIEGALKSLLYFHHEFDSFNVNMRIVQFGCIKIVCPFFIHMFIHITFCWKLMHCRIMWCWAANPLRQHHMNSVTYRKSGVWKNNKTCVYWLYPSLNI